MKVAISESTKFKVEYETDQAHITNPEDEWSVTIYRTGSLHVFSHGRLCYVVDIRTNVVSVYGNGATC